jgi:hypothetical protein
VALVSRWLVTKLWRRRLNPVWLDSVSKTVDAISVELRLLPNLEEVTRETNVLLPNATKSRGGEFVSS